MNAIATLSTAVQVALLVVAAALAIALVHGAVAFLGTSRARRWQVHRWLPAFDAATVVAALLAALWIVVDEPLARSVALGILAVAALWALRTSLDDVANGVVLRTGNALERDGWVRIGGTEGRVRTLGLRAVVVETEHGDRVVIPYGIVARTTLVTSPATADTTRAHTFTVSLPARFGAHAATAAIRAAALNSMWSAPTRDPDIEPKAESDDQLFYTVTVHTLAENRGIDIEQSVRAALARMG